MALTEQAKKRCDQLFELGLMFNGEAYVKDDFNVHWVDITCHTDDQWDKMLAKIKAEMERRADIRNTMINRYAVRLEKGLSKEDFLCALGFRDADFELDPESNPVTVWVTTSLSKSDLMDFEGVEDVVEATKG